MPRGNKGGRTTRSAPPRTNRPVDDAPRVDLQALRQRLYSIVTPVVTDLGYDLEDLAVSRAGRRHVVRVVVDGDDGVGLDAVAIVARAVSTALDAAEDRDGELAPGEYTLEVSSPGVDRPLVTARQWRRNIGRLVQTRRDGKPLTGRIIAADDETVTLQTETEDLCVPLAELGPGKVQVEFSRLADLDDEDMVDFTAGDHDDEDEDES
jgi:ribosome maturation factor RimP